MKIYLVGGAIRDKLLNLSIKEKDWVVVGSDIDEMLKLGYYQVGKNFPVFINPLSKEEYALARTEKKNGLGYYGFICFFSKKTLLLEDLYRRDLTINAIAKDKNGKIIDPYNGVKDIKNKIIRHISINFSDDPLRVLRVARFFAYLYHLNFRIKLNTFKLIKNISNSKELEYISLERIWIETKKAILTKNPECYFRVLYICGALKKIFPEIYFLIKIKKKYTNIKSIFINYINKIRNLESNYIIIFSSILYIFYDFFLIKNNFKIKKIIIKNILNLSNKLKIPNKIKNIINKLHYYYELNINILNMNIDKIIDIFHYINIYNNKNNLENFIKISFINQDKKIIFIKHNFFYTKEELFKKIWNLMNVVSIKEIISDDFNKIFIKKELIIRQKKFLYFYFFI